MRFHSRVREYALLVHLRSLQTPLKYERLALFSHDRVLPEWAKHKLTITPQKMPKTKILNKINYLMKRRKMQLKTINKIALIESIESLFKCLTMQTIISKNF